MVDLICLCEASCALGESAAGVIQGRARDRGRHGAMEQEEPMEPLDSYDGEFAPIPGMDVEQAFSDSLSFEMPLGSFILEDGVGPRGAKRVAEESFGNERFLQENDGIVQTSPQQEGSSRASRKHRRSSKGMRLPKVLKFRGRLASHSSHSLSTVSHRGAGDSGLSKVPVVRSASLSSDVEQRRRRRSNSSASGAASCNSSPRRAGSRSGSVSSADWRALPVGLVQMERRVSLGCASDKSSGRASSVGEESFSDCISDCERYVIAS